MSDWGSSDNESSSLFTSEDVELLLTAGQFAAFSSKCMIGELLMYGAYFALSLMAMYTIVSRRAQRLSRKYFLLTALLLTFSIATLLCGFDIASIIVLYDIIFADGPSPVQGRFDTYNAWVGRTKIQPVGYWLGSVGDMGLLYIISDILAAWRAMAIWKCGSRRLLWMVQFFFIFSSFALWIGCATVASLRPMAISPFTGLPEHGAGPVVHKLIITSSIASVMANLIATGMIGYTAHVYRRNTNHAAAIPAVRILAVLTESGLMYAVIQIARLIFMAVPSSSMRFITFASVFQNITQIITAMYTPLLILLTHYGYSMADTTTPVISMSQPRYRTSSTREHRRRSGAMLDTTAEFSFAEESDSSFLSDPYTSKGSDSERFNRSPGGADELGLLRRKEERLDGSTM
ncbi:hypothetical protein BDV98DRAFT_606451 [Pterulicium gracile]|uniref:Integral membrane protein n=1 Tax=Pterulicium gracile TaxID=1884261 RepID=A0A5C3QA79_9AGAR|nr:hypothetical protein BDV98DRAFT_606451 [Pterula gracilis]